VVQGLQAHAHKLLWHVLTSSRTLANKQAIVSLWAHACCTQVALHTAGLNVAQSSSTYPHKFFLHQNKF
jgi:hypothetical protein